MIFSRVVNDAISSFFRNRSNGAEFKGSVVVKIEESSMVNPGDSFLYVNLEKG